MATNQSIKAVIFDAGGVLISSPADIITDFENDRQLSPGSVLRAMTTPESRDHLAALEDGRISCEEFDDNYFTDYYNQLYPSSNEPLQKRALSNALKNYGALSPVFRQDMLQAVLKLKALGYQVAMLTNNFFLDRDRKMRLGQENELLWAHFHVTVESCLVGVHKPDQRIYQIAAEKLKVRPEECLMLDDNEIHVNAARQFGMKAIHVRLAHESLSEVESCLKLPPNTL